MIKVIIIEDEAPSVKKLKGFLNKLDYEIEIIQEFQTVKECLEVLPKCQEADLIFSDIELLDGNVFEALSQVEINSLIIFATAYDSYWMEAFEYNGIEYLLKPFSFERFQKSWNKFIRLKSQAIIKQEDFFKKLDSFYSKKHPQQDSYKSYLPVTAKQETYFLQIDQVQYFQVSYGVIKALDKAGKSHLLNQTRLSELEPILNPTLFFRINRSEIVNRTFIKRISRYGKNTIAISLASNQILKTSQSRTASFKAWMGLH